MKYLYLYLLFVYTFNIGYSAEDILVTKENVNSFQIEKAYTYSDELENYCYLLKPFNIIFDKDKNLYTYDLLQGFMVKYLPNNTFSKIMGNHGPGPGEFRKNGIGYPIYIFVINNKNIAAVELFSNRILIFGENGAFKTESKYKPVNGSKLIIKNSGKIQQITVTKRNIQIYDDYGKVISSISISDKVLNFIAFTPPITWDENYASFVCRNKDDNILLYIHNSSNIFVLDDNKIVLDMNFFPEDVVENYMIKAKLLENCNAKNNTEGYLPLFPFLIDNYDDKNIVLQYGYNGLRKSNMIYEVSYRNSNDFITYHHEANEKVWPVFYAKRNDMFFGIEENKIVIYKIKK